MFEKVLIANRGEIALRIHRACREMGIQTVAVHSTADADAMHVRLADESVCIGPPNPVDSYLNVASIISAAEIADVDAIHPGYGFLSENADFADIVEAHKISFIGPSADHIRLMGDKIAAKQTVAKLGIPVVPGTDGAIENIAEARQAAKEIGYPLLIKAAAGGGGRGMKVVREESALEEALATAKREARASFGHDTMYMERFLEAPRHIEIQIIADGKGNVVHLGERDCSLQRHHQKVLEETPSPALNREDSEAIARTTAQAIADLGYKGVGTVEYLYEDGTFYFIEMNTRLQVEHPITEMVTGVDIVREQIRIASGGALSFTQDEVKFSGHSIECRVAAEDPRTFLPCPGQVTDYHAPGGLGVRVESALYSGYRIPPNYDSLISKLVVHGRNRNECLLRLGRALEEYVIGGVTTTIPLHQRLLKETDFITGDYNIHWLEKYMATLADEEE